MARFDQIIEGTRRWFQNILEYIIIINENFIRKRGGVLCRFPISRRIDRQIYQSRNASIQQSVNPSSNEEASQSINPLVVSIDANQGLELHFEGTMIYTSIHRFIERLIGQSIQRKFMRHVFSSKSVNCEIPHRRRFPDSELVRSARSKRTRFTP